MWFETAKNWLIQNGIWIATAAAIAYLVEFLFKPLRSIFSILRSQIPWRRKSTPRATLGFVAMAERCVLAILQRPDGNLGGQISTRWHVTNAPFSGMPIKLLTAHLAKPRVADSEVQAIVVMERHHGGPDNTVLPGETQVFDITFLLPLVPSDRVKWPTNVEIIVIDQLENQYELPRIKLRLVAAPPIVIRVPVDRAECFRRQIKWDADTVELQIGPTDVTEEGRKWIAGRLGPGGEFKKQGFPYFKGICPPTKEEFLRVVREYVSHQYGRGRR